MAKKQEEKKTKQTPAKTARAKKPAAVEAKEEIKKAVRIVKPAVTPAQATNAVLRKWNMLFAGMYALQAVVIALVGRGTSVPVTAQYPVLDTLASEAGKQEVFALASRQLMDVDVAYVLAAGLLVFALVHFLAATRFRRQFEGVVERGVNTARWVAYGVGGALLFDALYLVSGATDLIMLKLLGGALLGACVAALAVELLGAGRPGLRRLLKVCALIGGLLPWAAILCWLIGAFMYDGKVAPYLYGLYASVFVLYGAIALATYFRWQQRGRWANTLYSEKMFMLLGLALATVLSWQIFAGVLL